MVPLIVSTLLLALVSALPNDDRYCYSCSSSTALCRETVYDGQHLSRTRCQSKCFIRREGKVTYRGCFDGWRGGLVDYNYEGCKVQQYLGDKIEWCFCKSNPGPNSAPCNGASRKGLGRLSSGYSGSSGYQRRDDTRDTTPVKHRYSQAQPAPSHTLSINLKKIDRPMELVKKEYVSTPRTSYEKGSYDKKSLVCYVCHDESEHCREQVTSADYISTAPCDTACFVRKQNGRIHRGCFDGWMSTKLQHDYNGCQRQPYFGDDVEWCFCDSGLCNGASMRQMSEGRYPPPPASILESVSKLNRAQRARESNEHKPVFELAAPDDKALAGYCWQKEDGIFEDPYDCSRYIHCNNGFTYRRLCPRGTVWDGIGNCDYPANVDYVCKALGLKTPSVPLRTVTEGRRYAGETDANISGAYDDYQEDEYSD